MTASRRQVNIRNAQFTPTGGSATTCTGVSSLGFDTGGSIIKFSGDGDRFPTTVLNDFSDPSITLNSADLAAISANSVGHRGTFSGVIKDARNQSATSGAGDITIVLSPAIVANIGFNQPHRQFGSGTLSLMCESVDGTTSPISMTIA